MTSLNELYSHLAATPGVVLPPDEDKSEPSESEMYNRLDLMMEQIRSLMHQHKPTTADQADPTSLVHIQHFGVAAEECLQYNPITHKVKSMPKPDRSYLKLTAF